MLRSQQRGAAKAKAQSKATKKAPTAKKPLSKRPQQQAKRKATTTTTLNAQTLNGFTAPSFTRKTTLSPNSILPGLVSPFKQQKRTNYSFMNISGPKDDRYLEDGQTWDVPEAKLFDNTLVFASIILERPAVCLKEPPQWEVDWYTYRHSKLSEKAWVLPKELENNMYGKFSLTPDEYPEAHPHVTDEDLKNNRKSLYRALEDPTYLICKVKQDFDEKLPEEIWMFPTTQVRESETIRSAAERTLFYHAGDLEYHTLGNTPIISHPVRLSDTLQKAYKDAKCVKNFYMHSMYLGGNIELEPDGEITDYAWVTQPELKEYFTSAHTTELEKLTGSSLYYLHPK